MKECYRSGYCGFQKSSSKVNLEFTKEDLKTYYKTIKDRNDISDGYKLKIANAILDM